MTTYTVIVGNLGTVYTWSSKQDALKAYHSWVRLSKAKYGRAAGEDVTLFLNDDTILCEFLYKNFIAQKLRKKITTHERAITALRKQLAELDREVG